MRLILSKSLYPSSPHSQSIYAQPQGECVGAILLCPRSYVTSRVLAQQTTGVPGAPDATMTVDGIPSATPSEVWGRDRSPGTAVVCATASFTQPLRRPRPRTLRRDTASSGLVAVRRAARQSKSVRFTALLRLETLCNGPCGAALQRVETITTVEHDWVWRPTKLVSPSGHCWLPQPNPPCAPCCWRPDSDLFARPRFSERRLLVAPSSVA